MAGDLEMKDAAPAGAKPPVKKKGDKKGKPAAQAAAAPPPPPPPVADVLAANVRLLERGVRQRDMAGPFSRAMRQTNGVRRRMAPADVAAFVRAALPPGAPAAAALLPALEALPPRAAPDAEMAPADAGAGAPGADAAAAAGPPTPPQAPPPPPSADAAPEVEAYAYLLGCMAALDAGRPDAALGLARAGAAAAAAHNRRTLDALGARLLMLLALAAERAGRAPGARAPLLAALRTATLRRDAHGAEAALNCLLRGYLAEGLVGAAEALRAKAAPPDGGYASPAQAARAAFAEGRIRAVRLEYSDARDALAGALRRAPAGARGFRAAAAKWLALVRLLLGEVPRRAELAPRDGTAPALAPYLALAAAVRRGDLAGYAAAAAAHAAAFEADGTARLVGRLRGAVIRAGLARLGAAYSRIALADVAARLGLPGAEDAEYVCAKAVRDGGLDAVVDRAAGVLAPRRPPPAAAGAAPAAALHARIAFCLEAHNDAVRAMRFEPRPRGGRGGDDAAAARERQEQELQAALEEDDMDFY